MEIELEVLGSPEGEVHLAGMPGLLLDSGKARQEGPAALPVLCALRPSGGDHGPHPDWMLLLALPVAQCAFLDLIDCPPQLRRHLVSRGVVL